MPVSETTDRQASNGGDGPALPINELFYSCRARGSSPARRRCSSARAAATSGVGSVIHTTSWEPTHATMSVDDIIAEVQSYEHADHVVLTGGEPLLHDDAVVLLDRLAALGYHTTVETNGTIHRDAPIDLASVSPKLASSTPTAETDPKGDGEWAARHDARRIDVATLGALADDYDTQLKFVVTDPSDMPEIESLLAEIRTATDTRIGDEDVVLMPEGTTHAELDARRNEVATLAMEHGYRYTPRLHVALWNDAPET